MATHVNVELQERIYEILSSDSTLTDIGPVYDTPPDNEDYPYVTIGNDTFSEFDTHTTTGFDGSIQIDTWSQAMSKLEVKKMQKRIYELLHDIDLNLPNFKTTAFRCNLQDVLDDPDGRTKHGVQRFEFLLIC